MTSRNVSGNLGGLCRRRIRRTSTLGNLELEIARRCRNLAAMRACPFESELYKRSSYDSKRVMRFCTAVNSVLPIHNPNALQVGHWCFAIPC
jgi:hypothetical protein